MSKMFKIGNQVYDRQPLLIVDYRVLCHKVYNVAKKLLVDPDGKGPVPEEDRPACVRGLNDEQSASLMQDYVKAMWAVLLNSGPDFVDTTQAHVIIVDDCKADLHIEDPHYRPGGVYWRNRELAQYKANRKPKGESFYSVASLGLKYVTNPKAKWGYFAKSEYEADDFAGAIVKLKRLAQAACRSGYAPQWELLNERPIILWTVDTDWLQLVGDGVWWANTGPWSPRLRGVEETISYAKRSATLNKSTILHPEEIVNIKATHGDKADNIPAGSPRYLIDLINVPARYDVLTGPTRDLLIDEVNSSTVSMREEHWKKSKDWIMVRGLTIPS